MNSISGNWDMPEVDDWSGGTAAGKLGWTEAVSGTGAAIFAPFLGATNFVALKMSGGRFHTLGSQNVGCCTQDLLGDTLSIAGGLGFVLDFRVGYSNQLSNATDTIRTICGLLDVTGAANPPTGNVIALECGGDATGNWRVAIGSAAAPTYIPLVGVPPAALNVAQNLRLIMNPAWTELRAIVNNVLGAVVIPPTGVAAFPNMTQGFPAIRSLKTVGTGSTAYICVDSFSRRIVGRTQN